MTKRLGLAALLFFYVGLLAIANRRHLWFDELYTFHIAGAPTFSELRAQLPIDMNPPLLYLMARASMSLLGKTALAVRLPSMLAFLAGSWCLYKLVSKRLGDVYGFLAVLLFWSSPAFYFAAEARPYALILGFFGVAMVARDSPRGTRTAMVLAAAVAGMMLSHFFAVLFLIPFLLAEFARSAKGADGQRKADVRVWSALLIPCILPFFFFHSEAVSAVPAAFQAGLRKMASYYYWALYEQGWVWLVALGAAIGVGRWQRRKVATGAKSANSSGEEAVFLGGLAALPVLVNAAMMILHGAFFTRYAVPALFLPPLALLALLRRASGGSQASALAMCALMAVYLPVQKLAKPLPKPADFARTHPELPLVAASGLTFLEMDHEQGRATAERLYYLTDREYALRYAHATLFEGLAEAKRHWPMRAHVEPFRQFVKEHGRFLVLGTPDYPEDWLIRHLLKTGARLEYLGDFPSESKDSQLFVVDIR